MFGYLDFLFLSYGGRIGRLNYWLGSIVLLVLQAIVYIGLFRLAGDVFGGLDPDADTIPPAVLEDLIWRVIVPIVIVSVCFSSIRPMHWRRSAGTTATSPAGGHSSRSCLLSAASGS